MQEAETDLKRAALDFLAAAETLAEDAAQSPPDPLDDVATDLFDLGDLEPVIDRGELADLKARLMRERLVPATLVELVTLARQVAGILGGV
ncbi:MAG: hypothetical protein ISS74_06920 [Planctomycetes bacterium]|nr:hypothetical protein [Planctomycetota bacterium]